MRLTTLLLIYFMTFTAMGQSCFNIGFEDSSFVGWEGFTGQYNDSTASLTPGIVPGRHTIMFGNALDSLADTLVSKVAPGSQYSARLGNRINGAQQDRLRYAIDVDSSNVIFVYGSAIVLQDPGHTTTSQPYFLFNLTDSAGNLLDTTCGQIEYFAGLGIPGFVQASGGFGPPIYRDWEYAGVDLSSYIGQTVYAEFTTKDCNLGGHYGYAYIDAACYPKEIVTQFCQGKTDSIVMTAPIGFDYLWNTGDTIRQLVVDALTADSVYFVTCTSSLTGCSFELSTTTEPTFFYDFDIFENSCGDATLQTSIKISRGSIANVFWDFGDTTSTTDTSSAINPVYSYPGPGTYIVRFEANDGLGCSSDTLFDTVNIYFQPIADFDAPAVCLTDSTFFENQSTVSPNVINNWIWNFGDGSPTDTSRNPIHLYTDDSIQFVTLIVWSDSVQCSDTITKAIEIYPLPKPSFTHFEPDSCIPHEVNWVNTSTHHPDHPIKEYIWTFGNGDSAFTTNPRYVFREPGIYTIGLYATDTNGCRDSAIAVDDVRVAPIPIAEFTAQPTEVHIESGEVIFDNESDNADGYFWQFGTTVNVSAGTSTEEDPTFVFKAGGDYLVTLQAYSNFGCFDTATLNIHVIDDRLFTSNVITPNGDGLNDQFIFDVDAENISDFQCEIFNRWGALVYSTTQAQFAWDGSLGGELVPAGVYFYQVSYLGYDGAQHVHRGEVQVLR